MNISRDKAADHLRRGFPVLFNGRELLPTRLMNGGIGAPTNLPPENAGGQYTATRHEDGNYTRAGLVAIIQSGGGVMLGGTVVTDVAELPAEDVLAAGDVARLEAAKRQQDETLHRMMEDNERTGKELDRARAAAEKAKRPEPKQQESPHVADTPEPKHDEKFGGIPVAPSTLKAAPPLVKK